MTIIASAKPVNLVMTVDAARSRLYYTETLGLALGQQDDFATVYDPAGTILRVTEVPTSSPIRIRSSAGASPT